MAMITAGLIIAAIVAGRFQLGAAMAVIHERQVASFEGGLGGQANTDAALQPTVRAPGLVTVRTVPSLMLAVPQLVVATDILPAKPGPFAPTLTTAVVGVPEVVTLPASLPVPGYATLVLTLVGATVVAVRTLGSSDRPWWQWLWDSVTGVFAGMIEWVGDLISGIGNALSAYLDALQHSNGVAWLLTAVGVIVVVALALTGALEMAALIAGIALAVVGVIVSILAIIGNVQKLQADPNMSDYDRGKLLGRSLLDILSAVLSAMGALKLGRAAQAARAVSATTEGTIAVEESALVGKGVIVDEGGVAPPEEPVANLNNWQPGDALPAGNRAAIDPAKFEKYSMDPANTNNNGKWKAWLKLGYDVHDPLERQSAAQDVMRQLQQQLTNQAATLEELTKFGQRFQVQTIITGPNGEQGTLVTIWQYDNGASTPRLITNWLKTH